MHFQPAVAADGDHSRLLQRRRTVQLGAAETLSGYGHPGPQSPDHLLVDDVSLEAAGDPRVPPDEHELVGLELDSAGALNGSFQGREEVKNPVRHGEHRRIAENLVAAKIGLKFWIHQFY